MENVYKIANLKKLVIKMIITIIIIIIIIK